jgi:hypothetical protein
MWKFIWVCVITMVVSGCIAERPIDTPSTLYPNPTTTSLQVAPTATPTPQIEQTSSQDHRDLLNKLDVREVPSPTPQYDRDEWGKWKDDDDQDCHDTRDEILIEESKIQVTFGENGCKVKAGEWLDYYSGQKFTKDPTIDHMVPLNNASNSGGHKWGGEKKEEYFESTEYDNHLIAISRSTNSSKGARGPEDWPPPDETYHCQYAKDWIWIKDHWGLSVTAAEKETLWEMLNTCGELSPVTVFSSKTSSAATSSPSVARPSGIGDIQVTEMDCKGNPETVTIENTSASAYNLTGWELQDYGAKFTFRFADEFMLAAGASVSLISGTSGNDTNAVIYWKRRTVWNNDGDIARPVQRERKPRITNGLPLASMYAHG